MPILIYDLKREYNQLLAREKKADAFLNDEKTSKEDIEKWMPEYNSIMDRLAFLLGEIKFYRAENIVHGFPESECVKPANFKELADNPIPVKQLNLGV